ncbi:hypothetical protein [Paraburkholderia sp. Ac-20347]|uniref:hypothetical protein n=1 Tax=Paraburkholderia sp. Ac-20347 TaxID=2703892 RepID=UPI0019824818|nr:hypothetical protein [Paraburkholderia sp. Ac-20347]MBN3814090.1 hypothetical protein [Paraburkholderia sp. Ac-20347]
MNKAKLVASMLAIAATLGTAHAAQVMNAKCADENNGTFGETASHQQVLCANGMWQDAKAVPMASVDITKYRPSPTFEASYRATGFVGTRKIFQNSDGHGQFTLVAPVVALNPDNTAHVVIDLDDSGLPKHMDATVPLDAATAIATDSNGAEYRVTVKRMPA